MEITTRKLREIDINAFRLDILNSSLYTSPESDLDLLVAQYGFVLNDLKDKHAPIITLTIKYRPNSPWYHDDLREMNRESRRLERRWISTKLEIDRQLFKACCKKSLPSDSSDEALADRFSNFFSDKIKRIKDILAAPNSDAVDVIDSSFCNLSFCEFSTMSEEEVRDIIMKSLSSTCSLDPIPTWLLKKCINELLRITSKIINLSFVNGMFPDALKSAHIKPLIKKPNLDTEVIKNNYRPVANLPFLAKAIERACASEIQDYTVNENLRGKV